jgi:hypothetical protein
MPDAGRSTPHLPEHKFWIKLHAVLLQQRHQLRVERHFLVMRFLILYVSNNLGN